MAGSVTHFNLGPDGLQAPRARVFIKPEREGPLRGRNPWIFSQAIARVEPGGLPPGTPVEVRDGQGAMLGVGYYHPATTIAVRMLCFGTRTDLTDIVSERIHAAVALRERTIAPDTTCYRLINGEGDLLSGLVVDSYEDVLVMQVLTAGMERLRPLVVERLRALRGPRAIIERSAGAVRREEGLADRIEPVAGQAPEQVIVRENGWRIAVDPWHGQKTGYFLDQRDNRKWFSSLAAGRTVLDGCCYGGGFALAALMGGAARVVALDTSAVALSAAARNFELNGTGEGRAELLREDIHRYLAQAPGPFDLIALDPPPLARSRKDAARAERLYAQLNALAMQALAPGGLLMTFSCSTHVRGDDFIRAARSAQSHCGRTFRLLARLGPGTDHPVLLGHGEGEYLTGVLLAELG